MAQFTDTFGSVATVDTAAVAMRADSMIAIITDTALAVSVFVLALIIRLGNSVFIRKLQRV